MNWTLIFKITTYLAIALITGSVILRFFKEFRLYIPVIIGILLLSSVGGTYAVAVRDMTVPEVMAKFNIDADSVAMIRIGNNLLLYGVMITLIVVYIASFCEGLSRLIKYLLKRRREKKTSR